MRRLTRSADAAQAPPGAARRTCDRFDARAARAARPGPVWSSGRPVALSAFREAAGDGSARAWSQVLGAMLAEPPARPAAELDALMRRVLGARAAAGAHDFPPLPVEFTAEFTANSTAGFPADLATDRGAAATPRVLLIDERRRGPDRHAGSARERERGFARLLDAARERHRDARFWLAPSSDDGHGAWLSARHAARLPAGLRRVATPGAVCAMLPHVDHVYVLGASEGLHALLAGKPLDVFGTPNYAGWGLTRDDRPLPERVARPTPAALFDCLFVRLARYLDPVTQGAGTLATTLAHLELQAAVRARFADLRQVTGLRFQWWKRPYATPYLQAGAGRLRWERDARRLAPGGYAALWGGRGLDSLPAGVAPLWIEDGFLHSHGLGSDMIAPYSQVLDRTGIYFDATRPNDLQAILNHADFDAAELARAQRLRQALVANGLTKYNLGRRAPAWRRPDARAVLLVIGQVADDASIRLGTGTISTADQLLKTVRARFPDAWIVYKPHPDVLSGNRVGLVEAQALADVVDAQADVLSLIEACDAVHTLSSLAGFDALLRGKPVHTYGLPFYAGWGLTVDALPQPRRERRLSLEMLTAGVLLRYPVYWDWTWRMYTSPEAVIERLAGPAARALTDLRRDRGRPLRKALRWLRNIARHAAWRWRNAPSRDDGADG
ncbi:capsular biosynthesis protein [Burkholderia plantarii]|uniref:capsular polysaccharide export protein, LipB/KpsS family n=1 Tax=Burkholderia plantarii TaxID=41899 RepID=UPI00272D3335|nr:capsular biosynthesis protein [Burkholderia plantarii]WLE58159.1 capsular biosynthesis protein [Burkholderia plantarii]